MLAKLVHLCRFSVTLLVVVSVTFAENEDDYTNKTTFVSLTGSATPFAYIETPCNNNDTSKCRIFRCSAFSSLETNISWFFRACEDDTCEYTQRNGEFFADDSLQTSSNITMKPLESGYLRCLANNSQSSTEVLQEVVKINEIGRSFINMKEQSFVYDISLENPEVDVVWNIYYQGNPPPRFTLFANRDNVSELTPKYNYSFVNNLLSLKIRNASAEDIDTQFSLYAENIYENKTLLLSFNVTDITLYMGIYFLNESYAEIKCVASSILPVNITWHFLPCLDGKNCTYKPLTEDIEDDVINLQLTSTIIVNSSWSGFLKCVADSFEDSREKYQEIDGVRNGLDIFSSDAIIDIDEHSKWVQVGDSKNITLTCASSAHNHSNEISWTGSDKERNIEDRNIVSEVRNTVFTNRQVLRLTGVGEYTFGGIFYCKAQFKNASLGYEYKQIEITFGGVNKWTYYAIVILLVIVVIITVFIVMKMRTYKKIQKELEALNLAGLANFEKGALEHLNPNLTIDDQADLLPYDKSYEFPSEQLKLGEQIGSGAFGVVVKGEAKGVFEHEQNTTVAVKMVNRTIGDIYIKALASELKIMIHLGKHVNVVNLLGACTKNITKRELLVIVEYCRFGNLKDYLLNHRHTFIDQINSETGQIDFSIGSDVLESNTEFPYITPSFANQAYQAQVSSKSTTNTSETDVAPETESTENLHYKGDYHKINRPVCSRDLLLWSFQIARGMDYLSSRKVLHGDLAARNILLTDGNVVKICDFGLSKKMYQKDIYRKSGDEMLPVKWMAIEAITDKIFSVQSDVWSFGIVLWEIFSLARTPYPGIEYNESFCEKLLEGYRMKIPQFATQEIYEIMLHCWDAEPTLRPSFSQLVQKIGSILEETIREHYVDMNTGYLKMNAQKFRKQNEDYLSMMGAPDFKKFSSPYRYVNVVKSSQQEDVDTYL